MNGCAKFHLSLPLGTRSPEPGRKGCLQELQTRAAPARWGTGMGPGCPRVPWPSRRTNLPVISAETDPKAVTHRKKFLLVTLKKEITSQSSPHCSREPHPTGVSPSSQLFLQLFASGTGLRIPLPPCEIPPRAPASLAGCKARGFLTDSIYSSKTKSQSS